MIVCVLERVLCSSRYVCFVCDPMFFMLVLYCMQFVMSVSVVICICWLW